MSNLNKTNRRELAIALAIKAISKHAPAVKRLTDDLQKRYKERHIKKFLEIMPEVPQSRWNELQQISVLHGTIGREPVYRVSDGKRIDWPRIDHHLKGLPFFGKWSERDGPEHCRYRSFIDRLTVDPAWSHSLKSFRKYTNDPNCSLVFTVNFGQTLPAYQYEDRLYIADDRIDAKLLKDTQAVLARMGNILTQGFAYAEQCLDLLEGCKTVKQLEDLFPEAAKLLPKAPPKDKPVAPVELATRVRRMLEEGVPED